MEGYIEGPGFTCDNLDNRILGPLELYDEAGNVRKRFLAHYTVYSPDKTILASVFTPTSLKVQIDLWDASTLERIRSIEFEEQADELSTLEVPNVTFSPDSSILAVITEHSARLWDVRTAEELGNLGPYGALRLANDRNVMFSPDGTKLVMMGDDYRALAARVWDISGFVSKTGIRNFWRY
jgi:WD40 repeat protein